uniref:Bifunctional inhibitor/plant lipid transfer protein/seed storage helical domain-containing protein n=1 Tax=Chenopodium quinoa TaxID=63459 RepID=A0A803MCT3_CHEQI
MSKIFAVLLAVALVAQLAAAQSSGETPSCASKLTACVNYLNSTTTPSPSCCNPLKEAVTNEKQCLCNIYNNPALTKAFGINITQAMNLPKLCHIDTGKSPNICTGSSPSGNAAGRITGAGLGAILLMFGAFFMFY